MSANAAKRKSDELVEDGEVSSAPEFDGGKHEEQDDKQKRKHKHVKGEKKHKHKSHKKDKQDVKEEDRKDHEVETKLNGVETKTSSKEDQSPHRRKHRQPSLERHPKKEKGSKSLSQERASRASRSRSRSRKGASRSRSREKKRRQTRSASPNRDERQRETKRVSERDERERERRDRERERDDREERRKREERDGERRKESASVKTESPERKKTPQETAADKAAEKEYKERVEAQLTRMAQSDDEQDELNKLNEAEERKKRRAAILAKFAKPAPEPEKHPEVETHDEMQQDQPPTTELSDRAKLAVLKGQMEDRSNNELVDEQKHTRPQYDMFEEDATAPVGEHTQGDDERPQEEKRDLEGYYKCRSGDVLDARYRVVGTAGKGVFSTVLRVRDMHYGNRELVIKVIRNNDVMRKAGEMEMEFLKEIKLHDPDAKKGCVAMESHFVHAGHLCLVFEALDKNLRDVLKRVGGGGLNIRAVRRFSKQMFTALKHLKKLRILHGDIKPDNILVNEQLTQVKVCDFGSAGRADKCELTPYLVSRFYRPPEIMVGMAYDEMVDMWSMGCVLYELYTGKILFPGEDNNDMLKLIMQIKGPFPSKKLKKAAFVDKHFDKELKFRLKTVDPLSKTTFTDYVRIVKPEKDLLEMLQSYTPVNAAPADRRKVPQLADLLEKIFVLDPEKRIKVEDALNHPFIKEDPQGA